MSTDAERTFTGLPTRQGFLAAVRNKAAGAILVGNLDRFMYYNQNVGHGAGDQLLGRVARCIVEHIPLGSLAAQISGDAFAVYLPDAEAALDTAKRIQGILEQELAPDRDLARQQLDPRSFALPPDTCFLTMSFGLVRLAPAGGTAEAALAAATSACRAAKRSGRNCIAEAPRP